MARESIDSATTPPELYRIWVTVAEKEHANLEVLLVRDGEEHPLDYDTWMKISAPVEASRRKENAVYRFINENLFSRQELEHVKAFFTQHPQAAVSLHYKRYDNWPCTSVMSADMYLTSPFGGAHDFTAAATDCPVNFSGCYSILGETGVGELTVTAQAVGITLSQGITELSAEQAEALLAAWRRTQADGESQEFTLTVALDWSQTPLDEHDLGIDTLELPTEATL